MGKRLITVLLLCGILSCYFSVNTKDARCKETETGNDKITNVTWTFDRDTGTMTFIGDGYIGANTTLYDEDGYQPDWFRYMRRTKHIVFGDGVTSIGDGAFFGFSFLETVTMADSVREIGMWAFRYCVSLKEIVLSKNLTKIGDNAFEACTCLDKIELPKKLKSIGSFRYCSGLTEIVFPNSIKRLDSEMLNGCFELKSVRLPNKIKKINRYDFCNTIRLKKLEIPKSVESVCMSAFMDSAIRVIDLPEKVTKIKNGNLGRAVFKRTGDDYPTKNLRKIIIRSKKVQSIQKNSFAGLPAKVVIYVPESKRREYTEMLYKGGLSHRNKIRGI